MIRRTSLFGLLVAIGLFAIASSAIARPTAHKINATGVAATVATQASGATLAGTLSDPGIGNGAVVYNTTNGGLQRVTFTAFLAGGSFRGTLSVTLTPATGGGSTTVGTGKITGGTAKYKGAKGSLQETGSIDSTGLVHYHVTGSVKY